MKRKSKLSKVLALCLAMVMVFAMSVPTLAVTSSDTGTITVNGLDAERQVSVSAYQIITVNVDDTSEQPSYPMYTWNSAVAAWLGNNNYSDLIDSSLGTNAVADAFDDMSAADETTLLERLAAAIRSGAITLTATQTQTTAAQGTDPETYATSVTFSDVPMGEYILIASGGVKIYQPSSAQIIPTESEGIWTVQNATVTMKSSTTPPFEKSVVGGDDTVAIGDTVTYQITTQVPDYPVNAADLTFYINDLLGEGFDYSGNSTITVYHDAIGEENVVSSDNYTVTNPSGKTFQINFDEDFILGNAATPIIVTYQAVVNANAFTEDALGNDAFLGYSNDPYGDSTYETSTDHDVYTYGIQLDKVNADGTSLSGAQFTLADAEGSLLTFTKTSTDGVYNYDPDSSNTTLEVSSSGSLQIQGLDVGTYTLTETKAPNNYVLPTGSITITLTDTEPDGTLDNTSGATATGTIKIRGNVTSSNNVISLDVENTSSDDAGFTLPTTGGMGTMIFTILGVLLMAGAVTMVIVISRKKRA
ncbi:MAG: SpaH/EbpB family LPXTG-anchored major pilin [Ruminococcus sp.]|jgi:fimbrial isopeptide formation D2 family protein/LPXTG-motif cell wall-anchored protein